MAKRARKVDKPAGPTSASDLARSLGRLTAGWTPATGVDEASLTAAREALAASILVGKTLTEIRGRVATATTGVTSPELSAELADLAEGVVAGPAPTGIAVVRSVLAASPLNPSGVPLWARAAQRAETFGPFRDLSGVIHWVDWIPYTVSMPIAFSDPASPFGLVPIDVIGVPPQLASQLELGAGSIWFLARLLMNSAPAGSFTGFAITAGKLVSSAPLAYNNGVYVAPAGARLTLTATLTPAGPAATETAGLDAAAAGFTPPPEVTLEFDQGSAAFQAVADASVTVYGSTVGLQWLAGPVRKSPDVPGLLIGCAPSVQDFDFAAVDSDVFHPSGTAAIASAAWALPLVPSTVSTLPEAAGPGAGRLTLKGGASVTTELAAEPQTVDRWTIEVETGELFVLAKTSAEAIKTTLTLWPEGAPSTRHASVEFDTPDSFVLAFLATPAEELMFAEGTVTGHLDRPLTAAGRRISYRSPGILQLLHDGAGMRLALVAIADGQALSDLSVALENALLGVRGPRGLFVAGALSSQGLSEAKVGLWFDLGWLLPTLPDPYAANFDLSLVADRRQADMGTLVATSDWTGGDNDPVLSFSILAATPPQLAVPTPPAAGRRAARASIADANRGALLTLLDLSTRVDLFGVTFAPEFARLANADARARREAAAATAADAYAKAAPLAALEGMSLALNGAWVATFALPQVSWEPMESTAVDQTGPVRRDPASDGWPLVVAAPDSQQLVPFEPSAVLVNNVANVARGRGFMALFSLPFGLNALIRQPNEPAGRLGSTFLLLGGRFESVAPQFVAVLAPSPPLPPPQTTPTPGPPAPPLEGAVTLTLAPIHPDNEDATFPGYVVIDRAGGATPGYGDEVMGVTAGNSDVGTIFDGDFGPAAKQPRGVPLRRIDLSGYGASIFSEWNDPGPIPPAIIKVQFETSLGRTAHEVIQAESIIYPYCVRVVRTITMDRQSAGWVKRTDTGWLAASPGVFEFAPDVAADYADRLHMGALLGAFNVRNIRDQAEVVTIGGFEYRHVLFDADLAIDASVNVRDGGFLASVPGFATAQTLVASKDIDGYLQLSPDHTSPGHDTLESLFARVGPFIPALDCTVEVGAFGSQPGTTLRCSAFQLDAITEADGGAAVPAFGAALRGAPRIPRGGGWSVAQRKFTDSAPGTLPTDYPVPLVRPATSDAFWYIADAADVLQLDAPRSYYSLLHSTGAHKVLFEAPRIPTRTGVNPPPTGTGLQFAKPAAPKPGGAPGNAGSPNLGDIASVLNSTGLFPDVAAALSLLQGAAEQIATTPAGFSYSKSHEFDPNQQATLIDIGVLKLVLQYADTSNTGGVKPARLQYDVDSSASPSWKLTLGKLSFLVIVPAFGGDALLTITGGFYADEHTKPGVTGLDVQMGGALGVVKSVFSDLQALAQFLPGGAGANLDVALSDGHLTVRDTFTIADMPLGLGDLTDISLDLGLEVQLQPLSVDFLVGIGSPQNPFNWIVSPLAGNGLINLGVEESKQALIVQGGIGLGLAIDLGIASGSASVTIAVQLNVTGNSVTLIAILTGQASVSVLGGLASAAITISAGLGFGLSPPVPLPTFTPPPPSLPSEITIGPETITLLATCSVGIHISICWVVSVDWDGSWEFSQSVTTPEITVGV